MKEIVIISGKGGTGKTSVTGSFAVLASNKVMADCDVDAADLHLILDPVLLEQHKFMSGHEAVINADLCDSCGLCADFCRFDAIEQLQDSYAVKHIGCEGCKVCVEVCPQSAIDFPSSHSGDCYHSTTEYGPMIHARLKAGAENSGKLVTQVRNEARQCGNEMNASWVIIDGPPGIGCPVISAITGVDLALIVTEPTLSGKHDLERVLQLSKHFSIPALIVINKWDLNIKLSAEIEALAAVYSAEIIGKLIYSPLFNLAQIAGLPVVKYAPNSQEAIELTAIWQKIESITGGGE
ncbi:ATP-binding protein [Psychromonas antarctica]|uniref:ATP-binding protein n=1 Tax=Psychromonas antarctica TaxID=67573 RepID=UPI001EE8C9EB|nr:ATP-binding protein [Psychromonas antarctica]MCG6200512.1 ATP-binding protein [Psychromonas antarctica]